MKKHGLFIKIFAYTMILAILLVCVTAALFSQQFMAFYRTAESRQIVASYQPLWERIQRGEPENRSEIARLFYENNQSFEFYIADNDGCVIYATPNADTDGVFDGDFYYVVHTDSDYSIIAQSKTGLEALYKEIISQALLALGAMLLLCFACAAFFARKVTKPVIIKLEEEIQRERELEETRRYFFSAASHELKTPIAASGVLLEGMLANVGEYKDHLKYLRECIKLLDTQEKLISQILEIVNLMDGKIIPLAKRLNLRSAVASVLPAYRTLAESNGQQIIVSIPDDSFVVADPGMLESVLANVILNALQNSPAGAEIRICSDSTPDSHRLSVLNTNTQIDEKVIPKLFDPFYRLDKSRSRKSGRSGLGLTLVRKTLEAMGVVFALENTDQGVLFWMDLPKGQL